MSTVIPRWMLWLVVIVGLVATPVVAQTTEADARPSQTQGLSEDQAVGLTQAINDLEDSVEADTSLEQPAREVILADLRAAAEFLRQWEEARNETTTFTEALRSAPERLESLRAELAVPPQPQQIDVPAEMSVDAVREAARAANAELEVARGELQRLQAEAAKRLTRLDEIPRQIPELKTRLSELINELQDQATGLTPGQHARRLRRQAERHSIDAQIRRLEAESASYRARQELLPVRRDLAQRRVDESADVAGQWQAAEANLLRQEAAVGEREALRQQKDAALLAEPLKLIAKETAQFAARRTGTTGIVERLSQVRERLSVVRQLNDELHTRVGRTQSKIAATGLSDAVGAVLRNELYALAKTEPRREERRRLKAEIGDAQYMLIVTDEQLSKVSDVEAAVPRLVAQVQPDATTATPDVLASAARELLTNQREVLQALQTEYSTFIEVSTDLDTALSERLEVTQAYKDFIEERILWTRSVPGRRLPQTGDLVEASRWLITPARWMAALRGTARSMSPPRIAPLLLTAAFAVSLLLARLARRRLVPSSDKVRRFSTDHFRYTLEAVPLTFLIAIPGPLLLWLLASLLDPSANDLASALASALRYTASLLLALEFIRHSLRPNGLADAHFRWAKTAAVDLRRSVASLELAALPLMGIVALLGAQSNELWSDALGRVAFVLAMIVISVIVASTFAPWRSLAQDYYVRHPKGVLSRTRWLHYPIIVGLPLTMAFLALVGYYYTALELDRRLQLTTILLFVIVFVTALVMRWLFVERRRLLIARARQKREAEAAADAPGDQSSEVEPHLDVPEIDVQTRRVVVAVAITALVIGVYGLWADILPALRMFERVQVWPSIALLEDGSEEILPTELVPTVDEPSADNVVAPGLPGFNVGTRAGNVLKNAVTLDEVALSLIIIVLTLVLSRNLPGLLEITVLKHLPMDAGARFAISAVLRYVLAVVGILLAFGVLGIGWTKVQWLVAALTFGLAFGLQEIFANFISGLIILAERPIRVGDTVTVGGVSGTVSQIRMRATTVRDWTLKELVIPNKVFITDQVVNWTLSDPRIRVDVPVGVSYGSDVRLVARTLLELARSQTHVLEDPVPRALFLGFGDSTLNFEVRVYLEHFDYFIESRSSLHMRITERFRELGIEIAFPQRDLHVRSVGPLADILDGGATSRSEPEPAHGRGDDHGAREGAPA